MNNNMDGSYPNEPEEGFPEGNYGPRAQERAENYERQAPRGNRARPQNPNAAYERQPGRQQAPYGQAEPTVRRGFQGYDGRNFALLSQMVSDFKQLFRSFFSAQPRNAFRYEQGLLTWITLLVSNVLIYALARGTVTAMINSRLKEALGALAPETGSGFWSAFGWAFLGHILSLAAVLGFLFLMSIVMKCENRPAMQYVKTLAAATLPYTLALWLGLLISLIFPTQVAIWYSMTTAMFIITLYLGFTKSHPSKSTSPYWLFYVMTLVFYAISGLIG